jgi:hypothetical protein
MVEASSIVTREVIDAIMSGVTRVTRRVEIFESDGVTPFAADNPRLIGGSVTVDMSRDVRRMLDCTLDNSDDELVHDPEGFWYDKILKVYRGVIYNPADKDLKIGLLADTDGSSYGSMMLRGIGKGYEYITTPLAQLTDADLAPYDVIVSSIGSPTSAFPATYLTLLTNAYNMGKSVFTIIPSGTNAIPLISTTIAATAGTAATVTPSASLTPFSSSLATYPSVTGNTIPSALSATTKGIATITGGFAAAYQQNNAGGRWFHYHLPVQNVVTVSRREFTLYQAAIDWLGNQADEAWFECQVGEFMIDKITSNSKDRTIQLAGSDRTKKLQLSKFDNTTSYAAGQPLETVVRNLVANAGVFDLNMNAPGITTGATFSFDRTTSRWDAIKGICQASNLEVFFSANGVLVVRPYLDPTLSPASLNLATYGDDANLVDYSKASNDSRLYNRIVVTGENDADAAKGNIWQAIVENNEPTSPTRISRIGQRSYYYTSKFFTNNAQCLAYANSLIQVLALESFEMNYSSLVFPWLEVGEIVTFYDPNTGTFPSRFLMANLTIPLDLSPMTGLANRVTIVG